VVKKSWVQYITLAIFIIGFFSGYSVLKADNENTKKKQEKTDVQIALLSKDIGVLKTDIAVSKVKIENIDKKVENIEGQVQQVKKETSEILKLLVEVKNNTQ
jgi:chromosome segregation ATPase